MYKTLVIIFTAAASVACDTDSNVIDPASSEAWLSPSAERIRADITYLASDELAGREPGTPGYDLAAQYVAKEFEALGLTPAGDAGSYLQMVPIRRSVRQADQNRLSITTADGSSIKLEEDVDFSIGASVRRTDVEMTAPIVFAGFGMVVPEQGRDDFAGVDVEGKIVALLARTPSGLESEQRAYFGTRKAREASSRGAIGVLNISNPISESVFPFARFIASGQLDSASMGWVEADGDVFTRAPNLRGSAWLSMSGAAKVFDRSGQAWADIVAAATAEGGIVPAFDTGLTMTLKQVSDHELIQSPNVAGLIEGNDPSVAHETIVVTAHLDHLGVTDAQGDDKINNGAMDNAAGVATMLEAARLLTAGPGLRRRVLFLAVTAEEQGLLGAQYFARNPTVPLENIVGNVNLDMPLLTYDFTDVIVYGGARSTLEAAIEAAGAEMGIAVSPDPFPEQGIFTRSDHFRFVEEGVPSVMLATGHANGGGEKWSTHLETVYHQPNDDLSLPFDWRASERFAELKTRILVKVANADERPLWKQGDFFARQFDGPMSASANGSE